MRGDKAGVGGFFEDLPVLMFILAGVSLLIASLVWSSHVIAWTDAQEELEVLAERLLGEVIDEVSAGASYGGLPSVSWLSCVDLVQCAQEAFGGRAASCAVAIAMVHPCHGTTLASLTILGDSPRPLVTGHARTFINAFADDGKTCIIEVRVVVW